MAGKIGFVAGFCYKLQRSDAIIEREKYGNKKNNWCFSWSGISNLLDLLKNKKGAPAVTGTPPMVKNAKCRLLYFAKVQVT